MLQQTSIIPVIYLILLTFTYARQKIIFENYSKNTVEHKVSDDSNYRIGNWSIYTLHLIWSVAVKTISIRWQFKLFCQPVQTRANLIAPAIGLRKYRISQNFEMNSHFQNTHKDELEAKYASVFCMLKMNKRKLELHYAQIKYFKTTYILNKGRNGKQFLFSSPLPVFQGNDI